MVPLNSFALWGSLGLAGIAVPIIIHLLYRKHRKETDWAAMELLRRALVIRSGQVKLEDYLILFLRCLALALLAFALLRPTLNSSADSLLGEKKVGMIIGIDASFSMGHGEHSRLERALDKARDILKTAKEGDPISIVLMSNRPEVLMRGAGYVPAQVEELLKSKAAAKPYRLGLERNLDLFNELAGEIKTPSKEVYILSDSQEFDWASLSPTALASFERLTKAATVYAVPSGADGEENLSLERLTYSSGSLRQNGAARYTAHVRNTGRRAANGGNVEFFLGEALSLRAAVGSLEPGEVRPIDFFASFDKAGDVQLKAQLSADDLVADNVRHAVARVSSGVRVLCVQSAPEGGAGGKATLTSAYFAVRALRLKDRGEDSPIKVTQIESPDLAVEQLGEYDVILLANAPDVSTEAAGRIKKFVQRGGGLIIFAGDRVDAAQYNERFGKGADGLLPATIGKVVSSETGWSIGPVKSEHLLGAVVSRLPEKMRTDASISKIVAAEPATGSETILSLDSGAPLLLSRSVGSGTVLLFTTSADLTWNELPRFPVYTMLMQQAVTNLTSRPDGTLFTVGEDVAIPVEGRQIGENVNLTRPGGEASPLAITQNGDQTVAKVDFDKLGVYQIPADGTKPAVVVAANVDARESDVRVLDAGAIEKVLGPIGVKVVDKDLSSVIEKNRSGREISHQLLWIALAVFLLQSILARYFTNKISRDDVPDLTAALQKSRVAAARRV